MVREDLRQPRQDAQPVGHREGDGELGGDVVHAHGGQCRVVGQRDALGTECDGPRGGDEVPEHRGRRGLPTGALAVEHEGARGGGLHEHRVVRAAHATEHVLAGDHHRVDPQVHPVPAALPHREQLDHVAGLLRGRHVLGGHTGDALAVHVRDRVAGVEREGGEHGGLGGGVVALDVRGGVRLRVAQALGLGEGVVERGAGGVHLVQHEVGGAVHDAQEPLHAVARERVPHGAHDRDGTGHRRLVGQLRARRRRGVLQLPPGLREQRLVARDHGLPRVQGPQHARASGLDPAGQLHDDVRAVDHGVRVRGEQLRGKLHVPGGVDVPHGDPGQLQAHTGAQGELLPAGEQHVGHLGPHGPSAQQADSQDGGRARGCGVHGAVLLRVRRCDVGCRDRGLRGAVRRCRGRASP